MQILKVKVSLLLSLLIGYILVFCFYFQEVCWTCEYVLYFHLLFLNCQMVIMIQVTNDLIVANKWKLGVNGVIDLE